MGREHGGGEERADDKAGCLHGKDEGDQQAAMGFAGVLAHDGGRNGVVAPNTDAEYEAESDEPPNVGGESGGYCSGRENQDFDAIDALAADHVGDTAKEQGANGSGE